LYGYEALSHTLSEEHSLSMRMGDKEYWDLRRRKWQEAGED